METKPQEIRNPPPRNPGGVLTDPGESPEELAERIRGHQAKRSLEVYVKRLLKPGE